MKNPWKIRRPGLSILTGMAPVTNTASVSRNANWIWADMTDYFLMPWPMSCRTPAWQLALNRLKYPLSLTEEAAGQYRKFLADHGKELVKRAVQKEDPDLLALMEEQGLLSEELTAFATSYAAERGAAEVGSFLMDYRRRHSGRRKKTFEL